MEAEILTGIFQLKMLGWMLVQSSGNFVENSIPMSTLSQEWCGVELFLEVEKVCACLLLLYSLWGVDWRAGDGLKVDG